MECTAYSVIYFQRNVHRSTNYSTYCVTNKHDCEVQETNDLTKKGCWGVNPSRPRYKQVDWFIEPRHQVWVNFWPVYITSSLSASLSICLPVCLRLADSQTVTAGGSRHHQQPPDMPHFLIAELYSSYLLWFSSQPGRQVVVRSDHLCRHVVLYTLIILWPYWGHFFFCRWLTFRLIDWTHLLVPCV